MKVSIALLLCCIAFSNIFKVAGSQTSEYQSDKGAKRVFPKPAKPTKTHSPKNEPELKIEPQLKGSEKVYINVILKKIKKNQAEIEEILKSSENYVKEIMNYV